MFSMYINLHSWSALNLNNLDDLQTMKGIVKTINIINKNKEQVKV